MSIARARVEARRMPPNPSKGQRDLNYYNLLRAFKKACDDYGILHDYKEHQHFVRKTDKKRRKKVMKRLSAQLGASPLDKFNSDY